MGFADCRTRPCASLTTPTNVRPNDLCLDVSVLTRLDLLAALFIANRVLHFLVCNKLVLLLP
jgi:hypothetical protein